MQEPDAAQATEGNTLNHHPSLTTGSQAFVMNDRAEARYRQLEIKVSHCASALHCFLPGDWWCIALSL